SPSALPLRLRTARLVDRVTIEAPVAAAAGAAGEGTVLEALLGEHVGAVRAQLLDRGLRVLLGERAVVALVDRGHRRDVAGAEALEAADEQLAVLRGAGPVHARGLAEALEQAVRAAQPAADVGADQN